MNTFETIIAKLNTQNLTDTCQGTSEESTTLLREYLSPTLVKERIDKVLELHDAVNNVLINTFHIEYNTDNDKFIFCRNTFRAAYSTWVWEEENNEVEWVRGENNQYNIQYPENSVIGGLLQDKISIIIK